MKLNELHIKGLSRVKEIVMSKNYIVGCTGRKVYIFDKRLQLLKTFDALDYAYTPHISPNEEAVCIISNSNKVYFVSLITFEIKKIVLRDKYNDNLEGRGAWSCDSKYFYLICRNKKTRLSILRKYDVSDFSFQDVIQEKYYLSYITYVKKLNKYLLLGVDYKKAKKDLPGFWYFIWYDGEQCEEYEIQGTDFGVVINADYNTSDNTITVYEISRTLHCDIYGKLVKDISLTEKENITGSFSNVFENIPETSDVHEKIKNACLSLGLDNFSYPDFITKIKKSTYSDNVYIGTQKCLIIYNAKNDKIECKKQMQYGVDNVIEFLPDIIAVSNAFEIKYFKLLQE